VNRRAWSPAADAKLRTLFAETPWPRLCFQLKRTESAITNRALKLGLTRGRFWKPAELRMLRERYPHEATKAIASDLAWTVGAVHRKANDLGLRKTAAFKAGPNAGRWNPEHPSSKAHRFPKGHVPANKGTKRPGFSPGRMSQTQFKKGQKNHNWLPVGSTRINADGYLDRKIADTGYPPRDWKAVHILLWEEHLGPVPPRHCICFKNRDKTDIRIDNLACISRAERMRRNTIHNLPPVLKSAIYALGGLRRSINRRQRNAEHDRGSARAPVRNHDRASRQRKSNADRSSKSDRRSRSNRH
jgi:hypothetical protein